jgi:flagellar motor switch protein FliN
MSSLPSSLSSNPELPNGQAHFRDVPVSVDVSLGSGVIPLRLLVGLSSGVVVRLHSQAGADLQIRANGVLVAVGEVVIIEDTIAVRVTHVVTTTGELVG